jgi:hypothetical protein
MLSARSALLAAEPEVVGSAYLNAAERIARVGRPRRQSPCPGRVAKVPLAATPVQGMNTAIATNWHVAAAHTKAWKTS